MHNQVNVLMLKYLYEYIKPLIFIRMGVLKANINTHAPPISRRGTPTHVRAQASFVIVLTCSRFERRYIIIYRGQRSANSVVPKASYHGLLLHLIALGVLDDAITFVKKVTGYRSMPHEALLMILLKIYSHFLITAKHQITIVFDNRLIYLLLHKCTHKLNPLLIILCVWFMFYSTALSFFISF